jgi:hypothetical protein
MKKLLYFAWTSYVINNPHVVETSEDEEEEEK